MALASLVLGGAALLAMAFAGADAMVWSTVGAGVVVVAVAEVRVGWARRHQQEADERSVRVGTELDQLRIQAQRVTAEVLPLIQRQFDQDVSATTLLAQLDELHGLPSEPVLRELTEAVAHDLYEERRRRRAYSSFMRTCAQRNHAALTDLLADLEVRKGPYWVSDGPSVSRQTARADLEALDIRVSAMGRLSQSLLALTGARLIGRTWPRPVKVVQVLRAAMGQTPDYQRVDLQVPANLGAITGSAVNTVMLVLSELIANALRFSPPNTLVEVSAEPAQMGLVLLVKDSGLGMAPEELERARRTVDWRIPLDLADLSGSRLGLAAARIAAERYRLTISLGPSDSGGVRASVFLPWQLLATDIADAPPRAPRQPAIPPPAAPLGTPQAPAGQPPAAEPQPAAPAPSPSQHPLPTRTPWATLPAQPGAPSPSGAAPAPPDLALAQRMGAFHRATRPTPPSPSPDASER
ncbi:sensor histidine kinase KdpD [Streptomyces sp. WAC 06783]|uniref:sensor histidine kinase n=1 Tax=Streptomyces sp. WAC 06783 TaxID=2203211 RepID=UPI000F73BC43|nr:ATP-binding protein [Streptomyces sp. WAC 06783]